MLQGLPFTWGPNAALGIMGGTFDPPHLAHLELARAAKEELGLDGVLFIPAGRPSFKRDREVADASHRLAMLSCMLDGEPDCAVSSMEIDRPGITYSVDTLEELRGVWPAPARLVFILGADSLHTLPYWHHARRVLSLADIAVASRAGEELDRDLESLRSFDASARVQMLRAEVPPFSSTDVRALLAQGGDCSSMLDGRVLEYIRANGLYRLSPMTGRCE